MATKKFIFDTPITAQYGSNKGKICAHARVSGTATLPVYMTADNIDAELVDITVTSVLLNVANTVQDITLGYQVMKELGSDFCDIINSACVNHMEYLFSELYEQYESHEGVGGTYTMLD